MRFLNVCRFTVIALLCLTACDRKMAKNPASTIRLQTPDGMNKAGVGAFAALPAGRKACYAVSITGSGIPYNPPQTCSPATGLISGFKEAGQAIEVTLPPGSGNIKLDLYLFLQLNGQNNPCPQMGASFSADQLVQTYLVGSVPNIMLTGDVTPVNVIMNFPGESQFLAQQMSLPSACTASINPPGTPGFRMLAGSGLATGTGMSLTARIGKTNRGQVATGTGIRLETR